MAKPTGNTNGKSEERIEVLKISPQMAREWLAVSPERNQRTIRQRNVTKILHAIETNKWKVTHQMVALDPTGYVLDGRHRLTAVASQRKHVPMRVLFNADPDTFDVIDTGAARSPGDSLKIAGYNDVNVLSAATRQVLAYPEIVNTTTRIGTITQNMTTVDLLQALEDPDLGKVIQDAVRPGYLISAAIGRYGLRTSATVLIALIGIHTKKGPDTQEEFLNRLTDGANLEIGNPILTLRKWLISEHGYSSIQSTHRPTTILANGVRTWNDYVTKTERHALRHRPGVDSMPEIQ